MRLGEFDVANANLLTTLTFMVIISTVVIQSISARFVAGLLGLAEPEPRGVLIVGANPVARALALELAKNDFRTLLADTNWEYINAARMAGLPTYFGNVVSEHADRYLDLVGIGQLFAMSRRPALNALACQRYRAEFGANHLFSLMTSEEKSTSEKQTIDRDIVGQRLFGRDVTDTMLASMLGQGAGIRSTNLTETHDFSAYMTHYDNKAIPLCALDDRGRLRVFISETELVPQPGWRIISLIPADQLRDTEADEATANVAVS